MPARPTKRCRCCGKRIPANSTRGTVCSEKCRQTANAKDRKRAQMKRWREQHHVHYKTSYDILHEAQVEALIEYYAPMVAAGIQ